MRLVIVAFPSMVATAFHGGAGLLRNCDPRHQIHYVKCILAFNVRFKTIDPREPNTQGALHIHGHAPTCTYPHMVLGLVNVM